MPEAVCTCLLCGSARSRLFDQRDFRGRSVTNRLCLTCGLVYQSPRMNAIESDAFYAEEYRLLQEGRAEPTERNVVAQRARAESLGAFSRPHLGIVNRHLDIGCSMGILLQSFQDIHHCQSIGVEPGEAHRNYALKEEGLTVYSTLYDLEKGEKKRFDLVSMAHVLEHLSDPAGYLLHLRTTLLDHSGWLLLEVPNLYAHDSFEIAHLVSFSSHTLRQVLEKAGFEIVCLEGHGRPRSKLLPLYLTVLAKPLHGASLIWSLLPEKRVSLKRRAGMLRRSLLERMFPKQAWLA